MHETFKGLKKGRFLFGKPVDLKGTRWRENTRDFCRIAYTYVSCKWTTLLLTRCVCALDVTSVNGLARRRSISCLESNGNTRSYPRAALRGLSFVLVVSNKCVLYVYRHIYRISPFLALHLACSLVFRFIRHVLFTSSSPCPTPHSAHSCPSQAAKLRVPRLCVCAMNI